MLSLSFRSHCGLRVRFFHCLLFATLSGNLTPPLILHNSSFFRVSTRTVLFFYMVIYWQPFPLTTKTMNKRESFSPSLLSTNWGGHPHQVLSVLCPGTAQWPSKKGDKASLPYLLWLYLLKWISKTEIKRFLQIGTFSYEVVKAIWQKIKKLFVELSFLFVTLLSTIRFLLR